MTNIIDSKLILHLKNTVLIFLVFTSLTCYCQTSIGTELHSSIRSSDYYIIKNGKPSKLTVTIINNPNDDRFEDKWEYEYVKLNLVRGKLYRNNEFISSTEFELDSLKRRISVIRNFKHKALGWEREKSKIVYANRKKELLFFKHDGALNYKMIVEYDSLNSPLKITNLNNLGKFDGGSTATYDYKSGTYIYKVFRNDMAIVLNTINYFNPNYVIQKNEFGDITEMFWPTSSKGSNIIHTIEYKYDKRRNWTRMKIALKSPKRKKVLTIVNRKIKYKN